ncbi:CgeB family protein [Acinetobacter rudis]|uniref:Spore protein YkvP/CgeB glycosyl transferase-like domain-containing protein n=1 Tax=Acinetobacter rudis TaxID=632955 RepID=A0AAW8JBW0_9GAMM|nr:glycosyltransferase [Acinetobacter rudis]MDQ8936997.1 hypothetical protein [Acinetobacter rudis]MDQ9019202.1 hypothetical protein [Acinetobacter rudis]
MPSYTPSPQKYSLNILCVLDDFTRKALAFEPYVHLDFANPKRRPLFFKKYDFLLVESTWLGNQKQWKYKVANYPKHPERNNAALVRLIQWAKNHNIPTIFWNKEDPFHFEQFIHSAQLFDYIFTTDANLIQQYQVQCPNSKIAALPFPFQPKIHYPAPFSHIQSHSSIFIGSYMRHMHHERRQWQDLCFEAAAPFGLTIVDRHARRAKTNKNYQFPQIDQLVYKEAVDYKKTASLNHQFQQAINVNTITNSPTMFSRRLIEIMACNRLVISNPSLAIDNLFPNLCETIETKDQAIALFEQLQQGYNPAQIEKINTARELVFQHYTVRSWLQRILQQCNIDHAYASLPKQDYSLHI